MSGFTKSYRGKWDNPIFRNLLEAAIWSWMCDAAAWKETKIRYNERLIVLERGQLATSRRFISQGFCVGEQVTRTFLENLEKDGMINQQPTHRGTIITICNYDKYQAYEKIDNPQANQQLTSSQPTANPNKKEDKNIRKEYIVQFSEFWDLYPRKKSKGQAEKAFIKALKETTYEALIASIKRYAEECRGKDVEFIPYPSSWLNGKRWTDEETKPKVKKYEWLKN